MKKKIQSIKFIINQPILKAIRIFAELKTEDNVASIIISQLNNTIIH